MRSMSTHHESILDQFTRQAAHYLQMPGHNDEESLRLLMNMAAVSGQDTVLDVACGSGIVACAFAAAANHVTGIDLTPAMLEQAQSLARQRGLANVSWRQGGAEKLPFPDDSFSIVLSRYAFHHFPRPGVVLSEMARVCQRGGKVLIADAAPQPDKADAYNHFEKLLDPSHHRALTLEEFQNLMTAAGLQNAQVAFYKMEEELERHLAALYPNPGDDEKVRRLVREDVGVDRLGVGAHLRGDELHFAYPVAVIVAGKAR